MPRFLKLLPLLALFAQAIAQTPFSLDSAAAYLRTISVEIGPRPMGSPNERRALEFALSKFREFGLQEAYLMPMKEAGGKSGMRTSNTQSGVAVGILKGATDRMIVIGAHIDSEGPEIPGANDDGSGSAVVLEAARVLSQRKNESTIVFALFGGEEEGLQGSRFFVQNFPHIDRVALMLQVDMANGSDWLMPMLDAATHSTPEWLVKASYGEFEKLGYSGLSFPTHFFALMSGLPGGGIGSDHQSFLEKNVPAIGFTSDPSDPIHTPRDSYENFTVSGLKRSGDLVFRLVERFDAGVPEEKIGRYYLLQLQTFLVFIPLWLMYPFALVALTLSIFVLLKLQRARTPEGEAGKQRIPALKFFLLALIIQTFVWLSENIVAFIKGVRHPWLADLSGYFVLAFFAGCLGIWVALRLVPKLHVRKDAYSYFLRAVTILTIFLIAALLHSAKLILYPTAALILLSFATIARNPIVKLLFYLLSPYLMYRLFFSEGFDFIARTLGSMPEIGATRSTILHLIYILFFSVWSLPFLLGFAAVYFDSGVDLLWLKGFRNWWGFAVPSCGLIITVIFLVSRPSFSQYWRPTIWIEQTWDMNSSKGSLTVRSPEYLSNTRIRFANSDTTLRGRQLRASFEGIPVPNESWISAERSIETAATDSGTAIGILLKLHTKFRPFTLGVSYTGSKLRTLEAGSVLASTTTDSSISLQWYSFPDTALMIPLHFTISGADSITERIVAVFVEEAMSVNMDIGVAVDYIRRTRITQETVLPARRLAGGPAPVDLSFSLLTID